MKNIRLVVEKPCITMLLMALIAPCYADDKTLYYMHGSDLFGKPDDSKHMKRYRRIVEYLGERGFNVVFEPKAYANIDRDVSDIVDQVEAKIAGGAKPEDIIVGGFSYGSIISLLAATKLGNSTINYLLLAGCPYNPNIDIDINYDLVKGRILSIFDTDDHKFGSCKEFLPAKDVQFKEIEIDSGKGHKVFKFIKKKWMNLWVEPLVEWANQV